MTDASIEFLNPRLLWLLLLILPVVAYYIWRVARGGASIQISSVAGVEGAPPTIRYYLRHVPFALRCLALIFLITALARPQKSYVDSYTKTEGIDIVLALDVSTSMLARDFKPDRITVAKEVASRFVMERPNDRIGLVIFGSESFTQCPLTTDKRSLLGLLAQVRCGMIADGTAIGVGLATAVNRLRESDADSKIIILLTDGINNSSMIAPITAAEIARSHDIKVYTIGVGTHGVAPSPTMNAWGMISFEPQKVEIDEKTLGEIARLTGGQYFRATDKNTLTEIYDNINSLEKTEMEVSTFTRHREMMATYLIWALGLLMADFLLRSLYLRRIP